MAAWKNIIAFTVFTVVWVAPEKFRSLSPLPPSVLPSFLPSVSFRRRRHRRPSITRVKVISQLVLAQRPWSHIRYIPAQRSAVLSLGHTGLRSRVRLLAGSQAKTGKGRQASRQAGRQASRQAGRQASRQAGRQAGRQPGRSRQQAGNTGLLGRVVHGSRHIVGSRWVGYIRGRIGGASLCST